LPVKQFAEPSLWRSAAFPEIVLSTTRFWSEPGSSQIPFSSSPAIVLPRMRTPSLLCRYSPALVDPSTPTRRLWCRVLPSTAMLPDESSTMTPREFAHEALSSTLSVPFPVSEIAPM
jgi:hypothetical protein